MYTWNGRMEWENGWENGMGNGMGEWNGRMEWENGNGRMEWENGMTRECGWGNSSAETPPRSYAKT